MEFINHVNLKLLQAFLAVAEFQSFRLAGEALHRSHSSISTQIQSLEEQLDVRLFDRTTRKVELTDEGRFLRESAQKALYEINLGMRQIRESTDFKRGQLSIACSSSIASTHLPPVLVAYMAAYPQVAVTVRELTSQHLFEALRNKDVDFAIGPHTDDDAFDSKPLISEPLLALVPRKMLRGIGSEIALQDLVALPIMQSTASTAIRGILDKAVSEHGLTISSRFQFIQAHTLIAMAEAGLGVAVLPPSSLLTARLQSARLIRIVDPILERRMAIIKVRGQVLAPAAAKLAERLLRDIPGISEEATAGLVSNLGP